MTAIDLATCRRRIAEIGEMLGPEEISDHVVLADMEGRVHLGRGGRTTVPIPGNTPREILDGLTRRIVATARARRRRAVLDAEPRGYHHPPWSFHVHLLSIATLSCALNQDLLARALGGENGVKRGHQLETGRLHLQGVVQHDDAMAIGYRIETEAGAFSVSDGEDPHGAQTTVTIANPTMPETIETGLAGFILDQVLGHPVITHAPRFRIREVARTPAGDLALRIANVRMPLARAPDDVDPSFLWYGCEVLERFDVSGAIILQPADRTTSSTKPTEITP